ncbi:MAG: hypothetical protein M1816_003378 [Peltula sp. TS41687]|nr:MAG: hypothetical protein M1816_003378 [Peltula sp. TS41687]
MTPSTTQFEFGQTVQLQDGRKGIVRHTGETRFSTGIWIGIELPGPTGKNDGSVQGVHYFQCKPNHGMFVRPTALSTIEQSTPSPSSSTSHNGPGLGSNQPGASARPSSKAESTGASTSRLVRVSRHSVTLQNPANKVKPQSQSRPSTIARPSTVPATSSRTSRFSVPAISAAPRTISPPKSTTRAALRPPFRAGGSVSQHSRNSSSASSASGGSRESGKRTQHVLDQPRPTLSPDKDIPDEGPSHSTSHVPAHDSTVGEPVISTGLQSSRETNPATINKQPTGSATSSSREVEILQAKLRAMANKRLQDRDKLKTLDEIRAERDKFQAIIRKLDAKYQPQQQELAQLREQLKNAETRLQETETQQVEHDAVIEMATIDREMAEQTAESLKTELDTLKNKMEELELEVEILREEKDLLAGGVAPEDRATESYLQMERNNEKLKDAIVSLRDMNQEQQADHKAQVRSLEKEVQLLTGIKSEHETTKVKLAESVATVQDLREQLDMALGAEESIEQLSQLNHAYQDQVNELQTQVDDLHSLTVLHEEIEAAHTETQRQMQAEIDHRDALLAEHNRRAARKEQTIQEQVETIARFRKVVMGLQNDLEDMRESQRITGPQGEGVNDRSEGTMDLNRKLQASKSRARSKTIELELLRLEAQQASEQLAIADLYLPRAYQTDYDPLMALLQFRRVSFKADLLHRFVEEQVDGQTIAGQEDDTFAGCDVLDKLTWISAMCDRFDNSITTSSLDQLSRFENALYELGPVERALDGWMDGFRRGEIDLKQVAVQLQGSIALMSHLGEVLLTDGLASYGKHVRMRALLIRTALDNTSTAMYRVKDMVQSKISITEQNDDMAKEFAKNMDLIITSSRTAKMIASKVIRALEDLMIKSLTLSPDTLPLFQHCEHISTAFSKYSRALGHDLFVSLNEEGLKEAPTYEDVMTVISETSSSNLQPIFGDLVPGEARDLFTTITPILSTLITKLGELHNLSSDLSELTSFEWPSTPWAIRGHELELAAQVPEEVEQKIGTLTEALNESTTRLKLRDQILEESHMKMEVLEAKVRDASQKTDKLTELERTFTEFQRREADLYATVEKQTRELQTLEAEREQWRQTAQTAGPQVPAEDLSDFATSSINHALLLQMEQQIYNLQSGIHHYREDNERLLTGNGGWSIFAWMHTTLNKRVKSREELRANLLARETQDLLQGVLRLNTDEASSLFELLPGQVGGGGGGGWKPAQATPQWRARRQHEHWDSLREWREDVARKSREVAAYNVFLQLARGQERRGSSRLPGDVMGSK